MNSRNFWYKNLEAHRCQNASSTLTITDPTLAQHLGLEPTMRTVFAAPSLVALSLVLLCCFSSSGAVSGEEQLRTIYQSNRTFSLWKGAYQVLQSDPFSAYDPPSHFTFRVTCAEACRLAAYLFPSRKAADKWGSTGDISQALWLRTVPALPSNGSLTMEFATSAEMNMFAVVVENLEQKELSQVGWSTVAKSNATVPQVCSSDKKDSFELVTFQPLKDASICPFLPDKLQCSQVGTTLLIGGDFGDRLVTMFTEVGLNHTFELEFIDVLGKCVGWVFTRSDNVTMDMNIRCQPLSPAYQYCYYNYQTASAAPGPEPQPDDEDKEESHSKEKALLIVVGVLSFVAAVALASTFALVVLRVMERKRNKAALHGYQLYEPPQQE
ncbi:hypothetical protein QOT17_009522 [Balamuthia mandrillaris]